MNNGTYMTRIDTGLGSTSFDSIAWIFSEHLEEADDGTYKFAVLYGNEDAPERIELWRTEPRYDTPPDRVWIAAPELDEDYREQFYNGYEACADSDSDSAILGVESDKVLGWHHDTLTRFVNDCDAFYDDNAADLIACKLDPFRAGQDFWLTRNRHGAGYWDKGYRQDKTINEALQHLTDAAHAYGSCELYVGDDGLIYVY